MNNRKFLLVFFVLCALLSGFSLLSAQETKLIKVVSGNHYPPFFWLDEKGNPRGIAMDILHRLEEKVPVHFEIHSLPFAEALEKTASGEFDMLNLIFKTPEREKKLLFSRPVLRTESWVYTRKNIQAKNVRDLSYYLIGVVEGDAGIELFKEKYPPSNIILFSDCERLMQEVKRKKLHAFLMEDFTAHYYLAKYDLLHQFRPLEKVAQKWAHFAFPRERANLLSLLNQGLSRIREEEWREILEPYHLKSVFMLPQWLKTLLIFLIAGSAAFLGFFFYKNYYLQKELARRTAELQKSEQEARKAYQWFQESLDTTYALRAETDEKVFLSKILQLFFRAIPGIRTLLGLFSDPESKTWNLYYQNQQENTVTPLPNLQEPDLPKDTTKTYTLLKDAGYLDLDPILKTPPNQSFVFHRKGKPLGILYVWGEELEKYRELLTKLQHSLSVFYLLKYYSQAEQLFQERTIFAVLKALEYHDPYTEGHSERVARYAQCISQILGISKKDWQILYRAALLHDIGKIAVPRSILTKKGTLTPKEYQEVKKHPLKSYELIKSVEGLEDIAEICLYHHERWDGGGYPEGKSGEHIPFLARVLAVADSFDAMTSERPYRSTFTFEEALLELNLCAGGQFDPYIIAEILKHPELLKETFADLSQVGR
ncbi:MAG: transporter substrate-binding domain-containing protein [Candidatus Atribacteria bacterium]|nr:transporter substrate-binding domain-containing protein [Candidatus Atribacteria bacterium]MCD6349226.1 transporter substrate-binding domain-containing protein [Candidatus Atribacteria bacterium]